MVDRSVSVRLRAETGQYVSEMDRAAQATSKVGDAAAKSQQKTQQSQQQQQSQSRSFAQSLVQSARENEQAWSTVGTTLVGVGAGITALGAAVLTTGINYNQLQQSSRAALTTMLGSAEAANAQMDKLDEFARSSPFSKQVFIEAQQQLIGFGTAAEDVIPILDSVQNAVAATGGSNQDIAELVNIIAQVGATGKITAQDLNEFGQRGVDAASIIGEQMGKTGQQIREEITAGTLDADAAIGALTDGMQARFGGAADAVKNTFSGALDRVSAAWRDLSSTIAEPLVGSQGGGLLVGLTNEVADFMRLIDSLPDSVVQVGAAFTGIAGFVTLAAGSLALAIPKVVEIGTAFKTLQTSMSNAGVSMKTAGIALGGITAALTIATIAIGAWASSQAEAQARVDSLRDSLDQTTGALTEQSEALIAESWTEQASWFDRIRGSADSAADAAQGLGLSLGTLTDAATGNAAALEEVYSVIGRTRDETADLALANAESMGMSTDQYVAYANQVREALERQRDAVGDAQQEHEQMSEATSLAADAQGEMADATSNVTDEMQAQIDAVNSLIDAMATLAGLTLSERDAHRAYEEALDAANAALQENGATLDVTTEKGRANQEALDAIADSTWNWVDSLKEQGASLETIQGVVADARQAFIDMATSMGMPRDQARELADAMGLIPDSIELDTEDAEQGLTDMQELFAGVEVEDVRVGADTGPAEEAVQDLAISVDEASGTVTVNGDTMPASSTLSELLAQVGSSSANVTIDGNPVPADMTLGALMMRIMTSNGDVTIGGENSEGAAALQALVDAINQAYGIVDVDADTSQGRASVNAFAGATASTTANVNVDAETAGAEAAINNTARDRTATITVWENIVKTRAAGGPIEPLAAGGPIRGAGTGTSDSIVASGPLGPGRYRLSNGEHVWTDEEVRSVGGHGAVMSLRSMARTGELRSVLGFADGGPLSPYAIASAPAPSVTVSPQISASASLAPEDRALLASAAAGTRRLEVNGRVFAEIVDETNRRFGGKGTL